MSVYPLDSVQSFNVEHLFVLFTVDMNSQVLLNRMVLVVFTNILVLYSAQPSNCVLCVIRRMIRI